MQAFETDNVTVAVVCPDEQRVAQLIDWTMRELYARGREDYAELFLFTAASPVTNSAEALLLRSGVATRPTQARLCRSWIFRSVPSESGVVFQTA